MGEKLTVRRLIFVIFLLVAFLLPVTNMFTVQGVPVGQKGSVARPEKGGASSLCMSHARGRRVEVTRHMSQVQDEFGQETDRKSPGELVPDI